MSFFAGVAAATVLTVVTVLSVAAADVTAWVLVAVGDAPGRVLVVPVAADVPAAGVAATTGVAFTEVGLGRVVVAVGFFDAMAPAAVAVAATGPGDVAITGCAAVPVGADCATAAGVADAHGSALCAPEGGCAFLCLKRDVMPETVEVAVAIVEVAWPAVF